MNPNNLSQQPGNNDLEDSDLEIKLDVNLAFNMTATTDINAALSEVEESVRDTIKEQIPVHFEMMAISVQEGEVIGTGEEAYQQFSGSLSVNVAQTVKAGETAEDIKQELTSLIAGTEYTDESGLCTSIGLYTNDQTVEL